MSLRGFLTGRVRPWRLLRDGVRALVRIAEALEDHNRLLEELHPEVRRHATSNVESAVTYARLDELTRAEALRAQLYQQTGRILDDDQLLTYLATQDEEARQ